MKKEAAQESTPSGIPTTPCGNEKESTLSEENKKERNPRS